jgi:hypothetical protein
VHYKGLEDIFYKTMAERNGHSGRECSQYPNRQDQEITSLRHIIVKILVYGIRKNIESCKTIASSHEKGKPSRMPADFSAETLKSRMT